MSGTPSISDTYAILGSRHRGRSGRFESVSLVVLARGPWIFRPQVVSEFRDLGFSEILLVEDGLPRYDAAELLSQLPELRLLVPAAWASPGLRINQAAREVRGDKFLVLWDDQSLAETGLSRARQWMDTDAVAVAPERQDKEGRDLPSVMVPGLERDRLKILALGADQETVDTLFPADFSALYDRRRFLSTGGFDAGLESPFWQDVDWGLRSRLWGESLTVDPLFRLSYRRDTPVDDQTPDRTYPRFYLRNLAVRHAGDHGMLPLSRLWSQVRSGRPLTESVAGFLEHRAWVRINRYRFQTDARLVTELWGTQ